MTRCEEKNRGKKIAEANDKNVENLIESKIRLYAQNEQSNKDAMTLISTSFCTQAFFSWQRPVHLSVHRQSSLCRCLISSREFFPLPFFRFFPRVRHTFTICLHGRTEIKHYNEEIETKPKSQNEKKKRYQGKERNWSNCDDEQEKILKEKRSNGPI